MLFRSLWFAPVPPVVRWAVYLTMVTVGTWIWFRPEPPAQLAPALVPISNAPLR